MNLNAQTHEFLGVSHDATLQATVAEVELDPTSATVACNIARKVASCVEALITSSPPPQADIDLNNYHNHRNSESTVPTTAFNAK